MMLARGLGIVPAWNFSSDPAINPNINPHVQFPPGWTQQTIQPVGDFYAPPPGFAGLGAMRRGPVSAGECCDSCTCGGGVGCCSTFKNAMFKAGLYRPAGMAGLRDGIPGAGVVEDASFLVKHRKAITIGGVALLGLAALGGLGVIFR